MNHLLCFTLTSVQSLFKTLEFFPLQVNFKNILAYHIKKKNTKRSSPLHYPSAKKLKEISKNDAL